MYYVIIYCVIPPDGVQMHISRVKNILHINFACTDLLKKAISLGMQLQQDLRWYGQFAGFERKNHQDCRSRFAILELAI